MRILRLLAPVVLSCLTAGSLVYSSDLTSQERIESLINSEPDLSRGQIGFEFADVETGEVLAQREAMHFFTPASNTKLYTTALALVRLGISYQYKTSVRTNAAAVDASGTVPDLIFKAGGDPNLSGRVLPYSSTPNHNDPLTAVASLATQIVAKGVKEVDGDIIADDSRYPYDPYPDGWTIDDANWYYGAPVSAFSINDNSIHVRIEPTRAGDLPDVQLDPEIGALIVLNEATTSAGNTAQINVKRVSGSNELVVSGTIGQSAHPVEEEVAVKDPALFAARALQFELENMGIAIHGEPRPLHSNLAGVPNPLNAPRLVSSPTGAELASITSAPLSQIVQVVNKVSQNLHTEMLLREVAFATRNVGTLAAGVEERKALLSEAGIAETSYAFDDGSGLARQDLTTPSATIALLRYMWNRPEREAWINSLPIGGVDGSLQHRFQGISGADRVHAKTGSLAHVAALSGYLQTQNGRWVAFSLMANAELIDSANVKQFFDAACGVFLGQ